MIDIVPLEACAHHTIVTLEVDHKLSKLVPHEWLYGLHACSRHADKDLPR